MTDLGWDPTGPNLLVHGDNVRALAQHGIYVNAHVEMESSIDAFLSLYEEINREKPIKGRLGKTLPKVDLAKVKEELADKIGHEPRDVDVLSYLMYPQVFADYSKKLNLYDNVSVIPTPAFWYGMQSGEEISVEIEPGKVLIIRYLTAGEPREDGTRTVFFELNGQPREVTVQDRSLTPTEAAPPKADPNNAKEKKYPVLHVELAGGRQRQRAGRDDYRPVQHFRHSRVKRRHDDSRRPHQELPPSHQRIRSPLRSSTGSENEQLP